MDPNSADTVASESASTGDSASPDARSLRRRRIAVITASALLALVALIVTADLVTASPKLCGSCHEMEPRTVSWSRSAHSGVRCIECHVQPSSKIVPRPTTLVARTRLLSRDVYKHVIGEYYREPAVRKPSPAAMPDSVCLQCHDPNRKATSGMRIKIDHPEHAKRNGSCVSCHVDTAHPLPLRSRAITLMARCMDCHGTAKFPKASGECGVCHPTGYALRPASHVKGKWDTAHGNVADTDLAQCKLCHQKSFCDDCHGLEMPHPKGWERGKTGHAIFAKRDRRTCSKCHTEKPDLCAMCHHKAYDPMKGTWVKQHYIQAREEGAVFCLECHSPVYCATCHVKNPQQ